MAKVRPNMIVTAMAAKKASASSGIIPRTVVIAAIDTGRTRLTPESTMAANGSLPLSICRLISSINTMAFLINIPIRLRKPSNAMNPNG